MNNATSSRAVCVHVVLVTDRPSRPEGPLEVKDVYKDRCRLSWNPPKDDGGLDIDHYLVEAMDTKTGTPHSQTHRLYSNSDHLRPCSHYILLQLMENLTIMLHVS